MSFRPDSRKDQGKTKMSVRDMRLFMSISGQKKAEEQETMLEELEGVKHKSAGRRSSSTVKRTSIKKDQFQQEDEEREERVSKRLKKMKKKRLPQEKDPNKKIVKKKRLNPVYETDSWKRLGASRTIVKNGQWSRLYESLGKIKHYDGFEKVDTKPLWRFKPGQEHRERLVICQGCEKTISSLSDFTMCADGICYHNECALDKPE